MKPSDIARGVAGSVTAKESPQITPFINPMRSEPAERFVRSQDAIPLVGAPSGGGGIIPPMWLKRSSSTKILVTSATVNGIVPTDINTAIDISSSDATWNIYLHATLGDDGIPTAVAVLSSTSAVPANTSGSAYLLIGQATVASSVITAVNAMLAWSQTFVACGRDAAAPITTPGTYYWVVA